MDEYVSYFEDIDPLSQYKTWKVRQISKNIANSKPGDLVPRYNAHRNRVQAAFIVSDPVDWGRDIQVSLSLSPNIHASILSSRFI